MPSKQDLKRLKQIYEEESAKILLYHDVVFDYVGYDGDVETVYIREDEESPEELTFEMLSDFEKRIKKEINPRWYVGIMFTDLEAAEKELEDNNY
tara:strand:+ start:637 stop:921 length:285 start_codon:yes stop_codon:yes gene_type:complete